MNPEKIKQQAAALAEIYAAKAQGRKLQAKSTNGWRDISDEFGPDMHSSLHCFRIKPDPRTRWVVESSGLSSCDPSFPDFWRAAGETVTEWMEVLP